MPKPYDEQLFDEIAQVYENFKKLTSHGTSTDTQNTVAAKLTEAYAQRRLAEVIRFHR